MFIHAYLGAFGFIFLCFLSYMPTEGVMSKKLGFLDLALSTDIIVRKHKNIKESPPKYAWMCSFNFRKKLKLKKL